ncbi:hypothetical protein PAT01_21200 [Pseudoalteromonas atlantica]|uniref:TonB-dependent receptor n=1 Tax=Pseudoalteromonas atlantica TaxID=288 RepID=A0ABQ0UEC2_PSEAF|nr:hypothetical protein PAT01_21200 [Pseudoalteromonas atlantica]
MTIIKKTFKLSALTAALFASNLIYAQQQEDEKTKAEDDIEIIEVSGLAASVKNQLMINVLLKT